MWKDPIVEEIHKIREEHAREHNFDLDAIFLSLKEEEKKDKEQACSPRGAQSPDGGKKYVSFVNKQPAKVTS